MTGLVSTAVLFAFWLDWCESSDLLFQPDLLAVLQQQTAQLYGYADPSALAVRTVMLTVIVTGSFGPLLTWVATALWVVPLLAWNRTRPAQHPDHCDRPPLRGLLAGGAAAGAASLVLALAVKAFFHGSAGLPPGPTGVSFQGSVLVVLLSFPLAAAIIFPAVARGGGNALSGAIIAGLALAMCSLGLLSISIVTGCVDAGLPFSTSCAVFGPIIGANISGLVILLLGPATIVATALALTVSGAAVAIQQRLDSPPAAPASSGPEAGQALEAPPADSPRCTYDSSYDTSTWIPTSPVPGVRRTITVAVIAVLVVGLNLTTLTEYTSSASSQQNDTAAAPVLAAPAGATTPQVRRAQLSAWVLYGGETLLLSLPDPLQEFAAGVERIAHGDRSGSATARSGCGHVIEWTVRANSYFTIPDPTHQKTWEKALKLTATGGATCLKALDTGDNAALAEASNQLIEAGRLIDSISVALNGELAP